MGSAWHANPPWARVYGFLVERSHLGGLMWRIGMNTDLSRLYRATEEIGRLPDGAAVLDIPCGNGVALRGVRPGQEVRYVAADISPSMLERTAAEARRRGVPVELTEADVGALPFDDGTFDLAVAFTSLHCFPDPARAVKELGRVLKPGGRLSGSAFLNDSGVRFEPIRVAGRLGGLLGPGGTHADLRRWLAWAGFDDVELDRDGAMTYFTGRRG